MPSAFVKNYLYELPEDIQRMIDQADACPRTQHLEQRSGSETLRSWRQDRKVGMEKKQMRGTGGRGNLSYRAF